MAYVKTNWENGVTPINATNLNNIETGIETNDTAIASLINDFYYKDGDAFQVSNELNCAGMLSSGRKGIYFTIPVEKNLKNITSITINSLVAQIRHSTGGYIANNVELSTLGTYQAYKSSNNTIEVVFTLNTASSFTNNLPVVVSIGSCRITFNE